MKVNCQEHRKSMELIGLKLRLKKSISDQEERNDIEKRIRILERDLKLD
ncbi:MAG: hypothetical protein ISR61_01350 [Desulfobacteraceae bacterium]|uniref:Uncharacterized protein n=1 Tax=Candidatus Desulfacyla euxinica TaxID=2841693 RepID=A0A8J6T4L3_9DELT|nr:hypothetical protein [Candidatus Desulfacyla euxinica]MBL6977562.1 hypothetical protein [Desulfobacteraceae bacterium]MBL7216932.1 hypothetical protein [Desulfobacteraceae bacterium]